MLRMTITLLAFETSSSVCDVALAVSDAPGHCRVWSCSHEGTGEHAERLLPMVDQLLIQAGVSRDDISAVAFGQGPGGFTGLRVACGVAQGMAFALGVPVIPVSSLQAVAAASVPSQPVCRVVVQDARMNELYVAAYAFAPNSAHSSGWRTVAPPALIGLDDFQAWLAQQLGAWDASGVASVELVGDALSAWPERFNNVVAVSTATQSLPVVVAGSVRASASAVANQALVAWYDGQTINPALAAPLYVRDKVAYTTAERELGLGGNPRANGLTRIRDMNDTDLEAVADLESRLQSHPWTQTQFADALKAGNGAWVAMQGDERVGFCVVLFAPDVAQLLLIGVEPSCQRTGVGYALLRHAEAQARLRGLEALILEVRPSNSRAVSFYRNRGFSQLSTRRNYYPLDNNRREDAWVMRKVLSEASHG